MASMIFAIRSSAPSWSSRALSSRDPVFPAFTGPRTDLSFLWNTESPPSFRFGAVTFLISTYPIVGVVPSSTIAGTRPCDATPWIATGVPLARVFLTLALPLTRFFARSRIPTFTGVGDASRSILSVVQTTSSSLMS